MKSGSFPRKSLTRYSLTEYPRRPTIRRRMRFKGKALNNLLKLSRAEDPQTEVQPWQVASYRELPIEDLFARLSALGICLNEKSYLVYSESSESPEDLIDFLWVDEEEDEKHDEAYLIIFELWRRLLPSKQTLSIFGDELDHLIDLYDNGDLTDEESLQKALTELEDILDQGVDSGGKPEEVFQMVSQYCAHDIETFLYDYIIERMDAKDEIYASELLDGFYDYVQGKSWFDFLKARLFVVSDSEESDILLLGLLEQQEEEPDLELCFEIARFVVIRGDTHLFIKAAELLLSLISVEEDFIAFLDLLAEFHRCLDQDSEEKAVLDLMAKRQSNNNDALITDLDKATALEFLQDPKRDKL